MTQTLDRIHRWIREQPLLYRFTLGNRLLLACAFLPTGTIKALGQRFTVLSLETPVGAFFEALYSGGGPYWRFIGLSQVIASILLLIPRTALLGALMFLPIIVNIFVITVSYHFQGTPFITGPMLLAALWLITWDWHRIRPVFADGPVAIERMPAQALTRLEVAVYTLGALAGFDFFFAMRSLVEVRNPMLVLGFAALCVFVAAALGIRQQLRGRPAAAAPSPLPA